MIHLLLSFVLLAVRTQPSPHPQAPVTYREASLAGESVSPAYRARMATIRAEQIRARKQHGEK